MGKKEFISAIAVLAILTAAPFLVAGGSDTASAAPARGGLDDPIDADLYSYNEMRRPGETDDFYIYVYNDYDGSGFGGSSAPGNVSELKEVKVSYTGILDEDMEPAGADPLEWEVDTIYNNNGDGYTISHYGAVNFYADASSTYLRFRIKTENVVPGDYYLSFRVDFRYMIDWDGATQYAWSSSSQVFTKHLEIRSHIEGSGYPDFDIYAFDENMGAHNIYAGSTNKQFGIQGLFSASGGTITDVSATASFPDSSISARYATVTNPNLPSRIIWRVDIPADTLPGKYTMELMLHYNLNGDPVSEGPTQHHFIVLYTPLLFPPPSDDLSAPFMTFSRDALPESIEVPFTNGGNVDLEDIIVSLDLDSARYIGDDMTYILEDQSGSIRTESIDKTIAAIPAGESRSVTFDMLDFLPRLPPGKYRIPIDYLAYYQDEGATGNPSARKITGHWYERNRYEQRNILREITYPENTNEAFLPMLLIEIVPDPDGFLLSSYVDSGYNQAPGTQNARMRLRVENYEMFSFHNLEYRIHVDDGSPFQLPYSEVNYTGETLLPIFRSGLSGSSGTSTYSDTFYFYASIRQNAAPGVNYFKVDIRGYTQFDQPFNQTISGYITITAHQPRFELISVDVGDILSDRSVEVSVEMMNFGLGGARNLTCFFKSSTSGFISTDQPMEVGDVMPGDRVVFTFTLRPDGERRYFSGSYSGNVYFSYFDDLGDFDQMFSGSNLNIRFDVYDKLPDLRVVKVEAPLVDRGDEFTVTVTVQNVGSSRTSGLRVLLPYSSAQFQIEDPEKDLNDLEPGESIVITFTMKALNEISDSGVYSFTMLFSYTDIMGRERTFSDGEGESFSIRTKDRIIPSEQRQVVLSDGQLISEGAGNVILGILIIVAVIVFVVLFKGEGGVTSIPLRKEKTEAPRAKKLELEEDEEEDDESVDEEDEESDEEMNW